MDEIVAHFVDEEWPAQPAERTGAFQIAFAERAALVRAHRAQRLCVFPLQPWRDFGLDVPRDTAQIEQLARALDLRMAGENLFHERRSRAQHADEKNRFAILRAETGAVAKERFGKNLFAPRHMRAQTTRIVIDGEAAQGISSRVEAE